MNKKRVSFFPLFILRCLKEPSINAATITISRRKRSRREEIQTINFDFLTSSLENLFKAIFR